MANLRKRGKFYSIQFWWDGSQKIKPLHLEDEGEAKRIQERVETAIDGLKRGRFPVASRLLDGGHDILDIIFPNEKTAHLLEGNVAADDGNPLKVSQLVEDYLKHLTIHASDGHRRRVHSKLKHLIEITDDRRVTTLNDDTFDHYITERRKAKVKPDTINGEMTSFKAMLNWAVETSRIDILPVKRFPIVKTDGADPFLFKADIDRIAIENSLTGKKVKELGKRMVLVPPDIDELIKLAEENEPVLVLPLKLVATTGMRRSEMVRLQKSDFDPTTGQLTVRSGKGSKTKRRTTRTIHVHASILPLLVDHHRALPRREKWLLPQFTATKKRASDRPVEDLRAERAARLLTELLSGTEFELLGGWHALRHGFITICVWKGMTFEQISQWTGHIERETQQRYTHYSGEASRRLMNDLPFEFAEK